MHADLLSAFTLQGRVAVVIGAASGIGRETACVLAEAGAEVMLCDVDVAGLEQTSARIRGIGGSAHISRVDVSDRAQVEEVAARTLRDRGRVDVWVNSAGVILSKPILDTQESDIDRVVGVNLKGVYWGCAAAGRAMKEARSGSIVNLSSGGGESPVPGLSIYSLTKAAVNMLTRTAAKEFGAFGVRANAIAPGWVDTPMGVHGFRDATGAVDPQKRDEGIRQRAQVSPLGITGTPRDIALAALYLASDASRFVTGQILRPNGGVAMP